MIESPEYVQTYFHIFDKEMKEIYDTGCDFDAAPVDPKYWFQVTFVLPVVSHVYKMKFIEHTIWNKVLLKPLNLQTMSTYFTHSVKVIFTLQPMITTSLLTTDDTIFTILKKN